ncbi:Tetratricopeptide repeat-containing protein [Chitinophaga sp. CF118]|uniref:tetratricopeptide repeat protein n=1 Tax=Chitinophaga sp. CF118 TaxID=1884367 RepID=UPI0008EF2C9E|nr:tetratricopeptide repeat protein [Chitinophaga sp. CF118]SFE42682.1 Tetratricopeptide repeat-containing protein [Chitinophaga sp. CF118]
MNSYFKTHEEISHLFQIAFEDLNRNGYDTAAAFFKDAFRHDPYRLEAHYKLAIYFASIKDVHRFRNHFFRCWNIDVAYKERIATDEVVVNALGDASIAEVIAAKDEPGLLMEKDFIAIDPAGYDVILKFRPTHKNEIKRIYHSLDYKIANWFIIDQSDSLTPFAEYLNSEEDYDFDKIDYFTLSSNRKYMEGTPEGLFAALQQISPYIEDVRFLTTSEWDEYMEEVVIEGGKIHIYLHSLGLDSYDEQLKCFQGVVDSYPEDSMLWSWLYIQCQDMVEVALANDWLDKAAESLDRAFAVSKSDDPRLLYLKGKLVLGRGDINAAIICFKEAVAKNYRVFEIYRDLGELLLFNTDEYRESAALFSAALEIRKNIPIRLKRALAYYKTGEIEKANIDIECYIPNIETYNNSMLVYGGWLFSNAGFSIPANMFFEAALGKNRLFEEYLTEKLNGSATPDDPFYIRLLTENTHLKLRAYIGLMLNAASPASERKYEMEALVIAEKDAELLFNIGVWFRDKKKVEEEEKYYDLSIAQDPHFIKSLNNKSIIRLRNGDYETVLKLAEQMEAADPNYPGTCITKGNAHYHLKDYENALIAYEKHIVLMPASELGYFGVGFTYVHMRQDEKAIPYLLKAIEIAPEGAQVNEIYSNLACCYNNTGRLEEGIAAAETSIAINPRFYHPYYMLACIYAKQDHLDDALKMVQQALSLDASQRDLILYETDLLKLNLKDRI